MEQKEFPWHAKLKLHNFASNNSNMQKVQVFYILYSRFSLPFFFKWKYFLYGTANICFILVYGNIFLHCRKEEGKHWKSFFLCTCFGCMCESIASREATGVAPCWIGWFQPAPTDPPRHITKPISPAGRC